MRNLFRFFVALALAAAALFAPAAGRAKDVNTVQPPADVWLKQVIAPCFSEDDKVSQAGHKVLEEMYLSPELRELLKADSDDAARHNDVGRLGFDWVINAQAIPVKWSVGKPVTKGDVTEVPVHNSLPADKEHTHYIIMKVRPATENSSAGWTIIDARYSDKTTLLGMLKQPYP